MTDDFPKARVSRNWRRYLFWLFPFAAAGITAWIVYSEVIAEGPTVRVYFENAEGLQKGKSKVMFRGVEVGSVDDLLLTSGNNEVRVTISLNKAGKDLARQGSVFWIEKARIGLAEVTGLQTIMGGDYVGVEPGTGKPQTEFKGIPQPPPARKTTPGRRIVILAEKLDSIQPHSPVIYHGIQVGEVEDCELGPDAQAIRIFVNIDRKYAPLVRMNSRFWNAGGLDVSMGLGGINMKAQSARTLLTGGIDFATPDTKDKEAYDGAPFRLYPKAEDAWLRWFPAIELPLVGGIPPAHRQPQR